MQNSNVNYVYTYTYEPEFYDDEIKDYDYSNRYRDFFSYQSGDNYMPPGSDYNYNNNYQDYFTRKTPGQDRAEQKQQQKKSNKHQNNNNKGEKIYKSEFKKETPKFNFASNSRAGTDEVQNEGEKDDKDGRRLF